MPTGILAGWEGSVLAVTVDVLSQAAEGVAVDARVDEPRIVSVQLQPVKLARMDLHVSAIAAALPHIGPALTAIRLGRALLERVGRPFLIYARGTRLTQHVAQLDEVRMCR